MTSPYQAQPIAAGYAYGLRLALTGAPALFPNGCTLRAEVRDYPGAPVLAGLLTTDSGLASIVDEQTVELFFSPALTGALGRQTCAVDLVRTDVSPPLWLGVQLVLPVVTPVTRSATDILSPGRIVISQSVPALATISAPIGVSVTLSPALGSGPWNQVRLVAAASIPSTLSIPIPLVQRTIPTGSVLVAPLTIAGTAVLRPAIAHQAPLAIALAVIASGTVLAPTIAQPSPSTSYVADGYVVDGYVGAS